MRISEMPPAGTTEIRCISAVQRQSGNSVEPASNRRSYFDMTPPIPVGKCMCIGIGRQVNLIVTADNTSSAYTTMRPVWSRTTKQASNSSIRPGRQEAAPVHRA
jgi:hypothetical protein